MARQSEVIGPRTHPSESKYQSWIRKIGRGTYLFKIMSRSDGKWQIEVYRSQGGRGRAWQLVHYWEGNDD